MGRFVEYKPGDKVNIVGEFRPKSTGTVVRVKVWEVGPYEGEQSVCVKVPDRTTYWFRPRELELRLLGDAEAPVTLPDEANTPRSADR